MLTTVCQRWRDQRGSYRPAGETIDPRAFEVAPIDEKTAKGFVLAHHYAASYPAARFRFGLYQSSELAGVAVFSHPCSDAVLRPLPGEGLERTELGRLVLLDSVKGNGESWFIARCFEHLRTEGIVGVISFSDPMPRTTADGRLVHKGHIGNVYQASNAIYTGRGAPATLRLLPDGRVLHGRGLAKIRARDRGCDAAASVLVAAGAEPLRADEDAAAWVDRWLPLVTRTVRHPGNHRYLFGLDKAARKVLAARPDRLPYPKYVPLAEAA